MRSRPHPSVRSAPRSAFTGYRFPPEVSTLAVRWYLRFGLSYRDVEELLAERGIEVDHVTVYRWVHQFAPEFAEAARACRHIVGDRWHVDETYLKVGGTWRYLFRAIDQFGQVIDVFLSPSRDAKAARRFFDRAIGPTLVLPVEVTTDRYRVYPRVLGELLPAAAWHCTEAHANNSLETDHGRLKARLRPMRGLKRDRNTRVIVAGHAFIQNLRRGFYDLGTDVAPQRSGLAHDLQVVMSAKEQSQSLPDHRVVVHEEHPDPRPGLLAHSPGAKVLITNFHAFARKEKLEAASLTKKVLAGPDGGTDDRTVMRRAQPLSPPRCVRLLCPLEEGAWGRPSMSARRGLSQRIGSS